MHNVQLRVSDLLYAAFKRWKMILALGLLGFFCGFVLSGISYLQGNYTSYEIDCSIAITSQSSTGNFINNSDYLSSSDFYLAQDMVDAATFVIKSNRALQTAIDNAGLVSVTTKDVSQNLEVSRYNETQVLLLTLSWNNADAGIRLMNALLDASKEISWFLFGMEQFKKTTTCSTIVKLLTTTAVFLLVREPGDLLEYCLIMGGGVFINQFMLWYYARQAIGKPVFNLKRSLAHGKPMLILFIPVIAVSLYTMMDKLMLGAMSTKAQLGFYEAAEKIILCASSVITAFGTVMMPRMTKLFSDGNVSESQRYMKLSVEAVMAGSFAISLGILSVSRLFAPIFWGKDFASCAYILSALALSIPFSGFANVIRMQYLIPNGMDRAYIVSVILGAVSNLIANSLLISIYGALGAALGTVIAEGIVCIAQCFAVRKRISLQKYLNCIVPFGVAGLIMAAAVRVIDHVAIVTIPWLLIEIFVGSIVYCSLSLLYLYYTRNELLMAGIQKFSKR